MARARLPVGMHGEIGVSPTPIKDGNYRAWVTVRETSAKTRVLSVLGPPASQGCCPDIPLAPGRRNPGR